jgi:ACS family hexuronate transporter-like MFS transporter
MKIIPNLRWWIFGLLLLLNLVNNMDRQVFALVGPLIQHDLDLSEIGFGRLVGIFQASFALTNLICGRMVDRVGVRLSAGLAILWFSIAQLLHIFARGIVTLGVARVGLAIGESPIYPATLKEIAEWSLPSERASAAGIIHFGVMLGPVLVPSFVPLMAARWGWQSAFVVTGVAGLALVLPWFLFYYKPELHRRLGVEELDRLVASRVEPSNVPPRPWARMFRQRQMWAYVVIQAVANPAWWFLFYWLPKFLAEVFSLRGAAITPYVTVVYAMAALGAIVGGSFSGALLKRGFSLNNARKLTMLLCGIAMPAVNIATHTHVAWLAVIIIGGAAFIHQTWTATGAAVLADLFPSRAVASVAGAASFFGSLAGVLAAEITGRWLQAHTGDYTPMFFYAGGCYLAATVIVHLLSPRLEPVHDV